MRKYIIQCQNYQEGFDYCNKNIKTHANNTWLLVGKPSRGNLIGILNQVDLHKDEMLTIVNLKDNSKKILTQIDVQNILNKNNDN